MTSRERVWKAINHQEPDMIPIDIGGTKSTGMHADTFCMIGKELGIDAQLPRVPDVFQMLCRMDEPIRSWTHTDCLQIENFIEYFDLKNHNWIPWTDHAGNRLLMPEEFKPVPDEKGTLYLYDKQGHICAFMAPDGCYFDRYVDPNYKTSENQMSPEEWRRKIPLYDDEELRVLENTARFMYENTDYSLVGGYAKLKVCTSGIFAGHTLMDWLCTLMMEPEYAFEILSVTAERNIENLKLYFQAVEPYIDVIFVSTTDYGTQRAELFSPELFKDLYLPTLKKVNDHIHDNTNCKTLYHSCGSIRNIIGYMIEAGVDCLNPIQTNTANMDPAELKKEFGDKLTFWGGGVETQTVYTYGTPEEVEKQVKERIDIFGPGGGFIFSPIHNTQNNVPFENICAMRDTILKYRKY